MKNIMFGKKDLVVTICCGLFLFVVLGATGNGSRHRAREIICLANLGQWGEILHTYASDHDGSLHGGPGDNQYRWPEVLRGYYQNEYIRLCPSASVPATQSPGAANNPPTRRVGYAWGVFGEDASGKPLPVPGFQAKGDYGSYGLNWWICNTSRSNAGKYNTGNDDLSYKLYWRKISGAKMGNQVPMMGDCIYYGSWSTCLMDLDGQRWGYLGRPPKAHTKEAILANIAMGKSGTFPHFGIWCDIRHGVESNFVFMDGSAKKVRMNEMMRLNWHRYYQGQQYYTDENLVELWNAGWMVE